MSLCEHGPGHSEVVYDSSSRFVATVGADSAMVLRDAENGSEVQLIADDHDYKPIRALAVSPSAADYTPQLVTGCEGGSIRTFSFPELQFKSIMHRFDSPVRQLAYSADGKLIAAVVEDSSEVHLFDVATEKPKCKLKKHAHHVRSVAFDPSGTYLASTGGDGAMAVWDLSKGISDSLQPAWSSAKLLMDAKGTPERHLHRLAWRPDGATLAVPLKSALTILAPGKWNEVMGLRGGKASEGHEADVSVLAYSPSGRYLATGDVAGHVVVWDTESGRPIDSRTINAGQPLCSLAWDPKRNSLLASDRDGRVIQPWTGVVPGDLPPPQAACMPDSNAVAAAAAAARKVSPKKPAESFAESEAAEDNEDQSLEGQLDQLSDDDDDVDTSQLQGGADRWNDTLHSIEARAKESEREERLRGVRREDRDDRMMVLDTKPQEPFTSGNIEDDKAARRQLGWSLVGRATCIERSDHSSVEVQFEDTTRFRRPMQFIDPGKCTMGDIGETGAIFASRERGETPSHLHYRCFDSWDREGWTCELELGEEVVSVAVGRKYVAAATNQRNLRIFSVSGTQVFTCCISGDPVSLAASETDQLAVVFHSGRGLAGEQSLSIELWDLTASPKTAMDVRPLPLSPGKDVTLRWIGFANNQVLATADTKGMVRAMIAEWGYRWTPICDLAKEAEEANLENQKLDVIGLSLQPDQQMQHLLCIPFKSTRNDPVILPKPLPKIIKVKLDLKDSGGYAGPIEYLLRQQLLIQSEKLADDHGDYTAANKIRRTHDTSLMKLMIRMVKADEGMKVLALCELSNNPLIMLNNAAKTANAYGKKQLTERLQRRITAIQEEEMAEAEMMMEEAEESPEQPAQRPDPEPTPGPAEQDEDEAAADDDVELDEEEEQQPSRGTKHAREEAAEEEEEEERKPMPSDSEEDADDDDISGLMPQKKKAKGGESTVTIVDDDEEEGEEAAKENSPSPFAKSKKKKKRKPKKAAEPKKTTKEKVKNAAKGANPFATPAGGIPAARSFFQQQSV